MSDGEARYLGRRERIKQRELAESLLSDHRSPEPVGFTVPGSGLPRQVDPEPHKPFLEVPIKLIGLWHEDIMIFMCVAR